MIPQKDIGRKRKILLVSLIGFLAMILIFISYSANWLFDFREDIRHMREYANQEKQAHKELTLGIQSDFIEEARYNWNHSYNIQDEDDEREIYKEYVASHIDNLSSIADQAFVLAGIVEGSDREIILSQYQHEEYNEIIDEQEIEWGLTNLLEPEDKLRRDYLVLNENYDKQLGEGDRIFVHRIVLPYPSYDGPKLVVVMGMEENILEEHFINALDIDKVNTIEDEANTMINMTTLFIALVIVFSFFLVWYIRDFQGTVKTDEHTRE